MPCEDEGRDQDDAAEVKEYPRLPANHRKLGDRLINQINIHRALDNHTGQYLLSSEE